MSSELNEVLSRLPRNFTRSVQVVEVVRSGGMLELVGICDQEYFRMLFSESGMDRMVAVDFNLNKVGEYVLEDVEDKYEELGMDPADIPEDKVLEFGDLMYDMRDDLAEMLTGMGYSDFKDVYEKIPYAENVYLCEPARFFFLQGELVMAEFEKIFAKVVEMRGLGFRMLIDNKIAPLHNL